MLVGYARVSSNGQSLDIQNEALAKAGCEKVFAEKMSARSAKDRVELANALDFVREGDTLADLTSPKDRPARRRARNEVRALPAATTSQATTCPETSSGQRGSLSSTSEEASV